MDVLKAVHSNEAASNEIDATRSGHIGPGKRPGPAGLSQVGSGWVGFERAPRQVGLSRGRLEQGLQARLFEQGSSRESCANAHGILDGRILYGIIFPLASYAAAGIQCRRPRHPRPTRTPRGKSHRFLSRRPFERFKWSMLDPTLSSPTQRMRAR